MGIIRILFFSIIAINFVSGQETSPSVIASAGDSFSGENLQLDWTIGEIAIHTIGDAPKVTEGFHQPHYTIVKTQELKKNIGHIDIFPNPTADWIEMVLFFNETRNVTIRLLDVQGKLVWQKHEKGANISTKTSLRELPSGVYILNFLIDDDQYIQSFQIEKTK